MSDELRSEIDAWIAEHWDPDATVAEWWQRLADSGFTNPSLRPPFGHGWGRAETRVLAEAIRSGGAIGAPAGLGMQLAAPTILEHGTDDQIDRIVPGILNGQDCWCQLFSEPGAGSDLAGLQTRAERDGDEWVVSGQKVWTSEGQFADWGMLIARTDPTAPKHRGISWFAFAMNQPGVEVRPLREMTGRSLFNEVFFNEARVSANNLIGDVNDGWRVANTTLMVERAGFGGGHGMAYAPARPGRIAGHLERPAGPFRNKRPALTAGGVGSGMLTTLTDRAREHDLLEDSVMRQQLAGVHSDIELMRFSARRGRVRAQQTGGEGNLASLRTTSALHRARDAAGAILGPEMTLSGPDSET
ncbi:MAG: acyl-CoA dehydrogenase, partial [Actinomycetia bacterium]|nr:acyl-CoA dehydrogenase [Actinomycetes bacterium]